MCYISTTYYLECGCYGKPAVLGEPCVRATPQHGLNTSSCSDKVDMGVDSVKKVCPKCLRNHDFSWTDDDSSVNDKTKPASFLTICSDGRGNIRANSVSSNAASAKSYRSTATCASSLLASLPSNIPHVRRSASGVGLGVER
jgi:hypothetical protein